MYVIMYCHTHICIECINKNQSKLWYISTIYVFQNQNWHDRFSAVLLVLLSGGNGRGWNIGRSEPSWHATNIRSNIILKNHSIQHKILIVVTKCHFIEICCQWGSLPIPPFLLDQYILSFFEEKIQMNLNWKSPWWWNKNITNIL